MVCDLITLDKLCFLLVHCKIVVNTFLGLTIKTHGSESRGQEEAACIRVFWPRDHYSELFTRMAALKF